MGNEEWMNGGATFRHLVQVQLVTSRSTSIGSGVETRKESRVS